MLQVSRRVLFKRSMKRFSIAWWAYSFPLTVLAQAESEYRKEVKGELSNAIMLLLSVLLVLVTLALILFSAINTSLLLPCDDPFRLSPLIPPAALLVQIPIYFAYFSLLLVLGGQERSMHLGFTFVLS